MRILLNNIAAMKNADVEIDGITVIAGENDSGKSTVSKALWCMFDSFYKYEHQFELYRADTITDAVRREFPRVSVRRLPRTVVVSSVSRVLIDHVEEMRADMSRFYEVMSEAGKLFSKYGDERELGFDREALADLYHAIERIVAYEDEQLMCGVIERNFLSEFSQLFCNVDEGGSEASATLSIQDEPFVATATNNKIQSISSLIHLDVRAIYIDDSFILDEAAEDDIYFPMARGLLDEDRHLRLRRLLRSGKQDNGNILSAMVAEDMLAEVTEKINRILAGKMSRDESNRLLYTANGYANPISASGMSAGMKIYGILMLLLQNGSIERRSTIILDEPEVHLHPEWQLALAEIIVLLQRTFDLHVLLTTHSPYFLRAVQVYAAKYSMAGRCRYYQAERRGKWCELHDVTSNTELIFEKLAQPFEQLEAEVYSS